MLYRKTLKWHSVCFQFIAFSLDSLHVTSSGDSSFGRNTSTSVLLYLTQMCFFVCGYETTLYNIIMWCLLFSLLLWQYECFIQGAFHWSLDLLPGYDTWILQSEMRLIVLSSSLFSKFYVFKYIFHDPSEKSLIVTLIFLNEETQSQWPLTEATNTAVLPHNLTKQGYFYPYTLPPL